MKRTIAAILAADVAGYSRLVAEDEEDALRRLSAALLVYREEVARLGGRVFNTAGDAILVEFPSAVEALRAAVAIQERLRTLDPEAPPSRRIRFRMGLTIGDVVMREDGDMLGDGVNVAARLEGLADPGGICLSRSVHEAVANKVPVTFRDIGPQRLKNIPRPVHAFRVVLPSDAAAQPPRGWRRVLGSRRGVAALVLGALALGGAAGGAILLARPERSEPAVAAGPERDDLMSVSVASVRQACFQNRVWLSGVLEPRRAVELRPEREGLRVLRVLAEPLAEVSTGQVLAELGRPDEPEPRPLPVRSPVSGIVGRSAAQAGAPAPVRGPALFEVFERGEFELAAEVPLAGLGELRPGQEATVTPLGLPDMPGRVRTVADGLDASNQLGRARILIRATEGLRPGLFARGSVRIGQRCGLGVPLSAIAREADAAIVYVASGQRVEARPVTTGLSEGDLVEIREGLDGGDAVVLRAGPFLRDGDAVRPIAADR